MTVGYSCTSATAQQRHGMARGMEGSSIAPKLSLPSAQGACGMPGACQGTQGPCQAQSTSSAQVGAKLLKGAHNSSAPTGRSPGRCRSSYSLVCAAQAPPACKQQTAWGAWHTQGAPESTAAAARRLRPVPTS